jgi:hypothetical protein
MISDIKFCDESSFWIKKDSCDTFFQQLLALQTADTHENSPDVLGKTI